MEVVNNMAGQKVQVTHAVLIHGTQSMYGMRRFATLHGVDQSSQGRPVIGPGVVADRAALEGVMADLAGRTQLEFIDPCILALSSHAMVWWRKPEQARVWFNTKHDALAGRTGVTPQPGLVFAATDNEWMVWAVKGNERPTPDTMLFQAPYMNIWEQGGICTGQADVPKVIGPQSRAGFEAAFFNSRFTHPNIRDGKRLVKWRGGIEALWVSLLDGKHKEFPERCLVPLKMTVADVLKRVAKGK